VLITETEISLFDLTQAFEAIREDARALFDRLLESGQFVLGPELREFEEQFAQYCGVDHCVGVSDGTSALELALLALDIKPGASVITVPNTFVAVAEAIAAARARPALVDVDRSTRCLDPTALAAAIDAETSAVVPVHLYGRLAPMPEIMEICRQPGIRVLEDAAQAHGASLAGVRAGGFGDAAAFSFYPTKNLGAAGDGGAIVSRSTDIAEAARSLRHHGSLPDAPNRHVRHGRTARLDELQAGLLSMRLVRLDRENDQRRLAAERYRDLLSDLTLILPPEDGPDERQVYHLFVIEVPERDRVLEALHRARIRAAVHYPTPIHMQPAWRELGYARGDFPVAEYFAEHCLSLPIFPGITEAEQVRVADVLRAVLG
jgi:dTDP-4-amino-4,6-dideoxygalactose transaminase